MLKNTNVTITNKRKGTLKHPAGCYVHGVHNTWRHLSISKSINHLGNPCPAELLSSANQCGFCSSEASVLSSFCLTFSQHNKSCRIPRLTSFSTFSIVFQPLQLYLAVVCVLLHFDVARFIVLYVVIMYYYNIMSIALL